MSNLLGWLGATISSLDDSILISLNQVMNREPEFDAFVAWALNADIIKFVPLLMVICWLWFQKTTKQTHNRSILVESVLISIVALVVGRVFALTLPFRDRPFLRPELNFVTPLEPMLRSWSSFPSDHAVIAFALATSLFRISPKVGVWALIYVTVFICFPRLYFGLHHPSDLIGGAIIGIGLAAIVPMLRVRYMVTNFFMGIERKHTEIFYAVGFFVLFSIGEMFLSARVLANYIFHALRQLAA